MLPDPTDFLNRVFAALEKMGFYEVPYPIDHICYRVESPERYAAIKTDLIAENELLTESWINGRPIATFRLRDPLVYRNRMIPLLELPSPKPGSVYPEGYEHLEFVIGRNPIDWVREYPDFPWDRKGINKAVNNDVRLPLGAGMSVKFHEFPLDYVIAHLD